MNTGRETPSISVGQGIVVRVNDQGETITVNVEDQLFIDKFYGLIERLEKTGERLKAPEMIEKSEREQLQIVIEETKGIMEDIDGLFGPHACRKIFGNIIPNFYLITDFFDQMQPIAEKYAGERQKIIEQKYNSSRKGGRFPFGK